jgi:6-phosphogluconolactonase (cycloisomerase 2 family)
VPASGDDALNTFKRNRDDGKLKFVDAEVDGQSGVTGLTEAYETTVAPDGRNVYVVNGEDALATFKRNRDSGKLRFVNAKFDRPELPLGEPYDVVASRDGKNVYVAFYNSSTNSGVDTFKRKGRTGRLRFVNAKRDGIGGVDDVEGIWRLDISRDDRNIYVAAYSESSVGIFKRHR